MLAADQINHGESNFSFVKCIMLAQDRHTTSSERKLQRIILQWLLLLLQLLLFRLQVPPSHPPLQLLMLANQQDAMISQPKMIGTKCF